jgi:hypothetical protein
MWISFKTPTKYFWASIEASCPSERTSNHKKNFKMPFRSPGYGTRVPGTVPYRSSVDYQILDPIRPGLGFTASSVENRAHMIQIRMQTHRNRKYWMRIRIATYRFNCPVAGYQHFGEVQKMGLYPNFLSNPWIYRYRYPRPGNYR